MGCVVKSIARWPLGVICCIAFTSLISMPCYMSHASVPAEIRRERGLVDDLVRISAGIESIEDLIGDLEQAFAGAEKAVAAGAQ